VLTPQGEDAERIDRPIYEEFVRGRFEDATRTSYMDVIARLVGEGADSVIMGCTEIPLLLKAEDAPVPLFDTLALHAMAAVDRALDGESCGNPSPVCR
jgi:aspartate racemase